VFYRAILLIFFIGLAKGQIVTHGPICGGVSDTGAVFILRTDTVAIVQIELSSDSLFNNSLFTDTIDSGNDSDDWAILQVSGLQPFTRYFYRAVLPSYRCHFHYQLCQ
jgi:phosphodiesterase/alkaline phosphatase D-like protein